MNADTLRAAGWFGKIPALGDFASRRLPDEFVHDWDDWLQHGLAEARERGNDRLHDAARATQPIRRFWVARGVLGPSSWSGVLLPSSDRVGRQFPLTVALPSSDGVVASLTAALCADTWFEALDVLVRRVRDEALDVDAFEAGLADAGPMPAAPADATAQAEIAVELLRRSSAPCSIWWCAGAHEPSQFLCYDALPPAPVFDALIGCDECGERRFVLGPD